MDSFIFDSYNVDLTGRTIFFRYFLNTYPFIEKIELDEVIDKKIDQQLLNAILFNMHLALGISYWKLRCPSHIQIRSGSLTKEQAKFWNTVYTEGLGEFYFRNGIDFRGRVTFPFQEKSSFIPRKYHTEKKELVGIGGGKDSVVTWELMKGKKKDITGLVIETQKKFDMVDNLAKIGGFPLIHVRREMDSQMTTGVKRTGYYFGHIPISMIYAWIGILVSATKGFKSFVVSNEKSADEENTTYLGEKINHQWSKSLRFEKLFSTYVKKYVTPSVRYYSPLRTLTELQIVQQFVKYPKYFHFVSSCNRNFSSTHPLVEKLWCGECPKCVFGFLLFAAHLPKSDVIQMFGKNLFLDEQLSNLFLDILGKGTMKPFDCVGTFAESQKALQMIARKGEYKGDVVFEHLMSHT